MPTLKRRVRERVEPLTEFLHDEAAGGIVLLVADRVAIVWANTPRARRLRRRCGTTHVGLGIQEDLRHWVNDGLMTLFFFVVGLEIKRELVVGDLRRPRGRGAARRPRPSAACSCPRPSSWS